MQAAIEQRAYALGGGGLQAPAARVTDFIARKASSTLPVTSYVPGINAANLHEVLDASGVPFAERLREALVLFGKQLKGYISAEAVVLDSVRQGWCYDVEHPSQCPTAESSDESDEYRWEFLEGGTCKQLDYPFDCGDGVHEDIASQCP